MVRFLRALFISAAAMQAAHGFRIASKIPNSKNFTAFQEQASEHDDMAQAQAETLGSYTVTSRVSVTRDASMPSEVIVNLTVGTFVEVVQIVDLRPAAPLIRARILDPPGGVSLRNTASGFVWAVKQNEAVYILGTPNTDTSSPFLSPSPSPSPTPTPCQDLNENCGYWADQGYCSPSSPYYAFMQENCCSSCSR